VRGDKANDTISGAKRQLLLLGERSDSRATAGAAFFAYFLSLQKESKSGFGSEAPESVIRSFGIQVSLDSCAGNMNNQMHLDG
jgi:hypothetical protein